MLQHPPAGVESGKLGREVLAQYMHTFDELAEQYRKADEAKFRQYAELEPTGEAVGERRHLTVMFCDLVGSTIISAAP
jgi:class 3 adenylate cyclase